MLQSQEFDFQVFLSTYKVRESVSFFYLFIYIAHLMQPLLPKVLYNH